MLRKFFLSLEKNKCEERYLPGRSLKEIEDLHLARYDFVLKYATNKVVLDVATGTGYGAHKLAKNGQAQKVIGIDSSQDAINFALKNYQHPNLKFQVGLAEKMIFQDNFFDLVVSMETIEHLRNYKSFLREVKRILKPGGLFIVSTPNKVATLRGALPTKPINPYHFKEFTKRSLERLLKEHFVVLDWFGQKIIDKKSFIYFIKKILGLIPKQLNNQTKVNVSRFPQDRKKDMGIFIVICSGSVLKN